MMLCGHVHIEIVDALSLRNHDLKTFQYGSFVSYVGLQLASEVESLPHNCRVQGDTNRQFNVVCRCCVDSPSAIIMSCGGCGCCPKCGCRATCTCNRNIFSLESQTDFSYGTGMSFTAAEETDGQLSTGGGASQSCITVAGGNGGECVNCGWHAPGSSA